MPIGIFVLTLDLELTMMKTDRRQLVEQFATSLMLVKRRLMTTHGYMADIGLNRAQIEVLLTIKFQDCHTVGQLAGALGITSGAVTQVVEGLVRDGLVQRTRDDHDRRVVRISFTPAGAAKLASLRHQQLEQLVEVLAPLTETEMLQLADLLDKIATPAGGRIHES